MPPLSAHLGYLFTDLPFEQRFAAAREAGFSLVETPTPYALTAPRFREICAENGLAFVQMAAPMGDAARGEKGLACLPDRAAEFEASIEKGIAYAREAGSHFIHFMAGVIPPGEDRARLWPTYIANQRRACARAAEAGLKVLIEPIGPGTIANYLMDDCHDGLRALDEIGAPNLSLLFDTFHAANAGIDPVAFVREHLPRIAHIHGADFPGRHEPGTGTIDFPALFDELERQGYAGSIGLEYIPATSTLAGLAWRDAFQPPVGT